MTYLVQRDGALPNQLREKQPWDTSPTTRDHGTAVPRECPASAGLRREFPAWPGGERTRLEFGANVGTPRAEDRIQIFVRRVDILRYPALGRKEQTARPRDGLHDTRTPLSSWSKRPAPHAPRRLHTARSPLRGVVAGFPKGQMPMGPRPLHFPIFFPFKNQSRP